MPFGSKIKELLLLKGISQASFAESLGITRGRLNNYVMGRSEPDYALLRLMAQTLQVSLDELLELSPPPNAVNSGLQDKFEAPQINPNVVFSLTKPNEDHSSYHWIPVYQTLNKSSVGHDKVEPYVWVRINEDMILNLPSKNSFALLVNDEQMSPYFLPGDIVFFRPVLSYLFLGSSSPNAFYAVRTDPEDTIGRRIRNCFLTDETLVMVSSNPRVPPKVIDLKQVNYVPIVGKAVCMTRSFSDLGELTQQSI